MPQGVTGDHHYWLLLAGIAVGRLTWAAHYLLLSVGYRAAGTTGQQAAAKALKRPTWRLLAAGSREEARQTRAALLGVARQQGQDILLLGSLALAAWTQLYAAAGADNAAANLSDTTRSLLFVGVVILITGPMLFRARGPHFSYLARESVQSVGYAAVVFSIASAIPKVLDSSVWAPLGLAVAVLITARDWAEVRDHMSLHKSGLEEVRRARTVSSGLRCLLVAKDNAAAARLRLALEREPDGGQPLEFREAANSNDALRMVDDWKPQLVVAEVGVSPYGAFGLVRDVKARPERSCSVILILERVQDEWLGRWCGADALFHRPFDAFSLQEVAGRLLAERTT